MNPVDIRLCGLVTSAPGAIERAQAAAAGGCTLLRLRPALPDRDALAEARRIRIALGERGCRLLVEGRVDLAVMAGADGVHLGQGDIGEPDARRLLGPRAVIGLSIAGTADADALFRLRVDYACIQSLFADPKAASGDRSLQDLARIAFRVRLAATGTPVSAAGAITPEEALRVIGAGADGLTFALDDIPLDEIEETMRSLRSRIDQALALRGAIA